MSNKRKIALPLPSPNILEGEVIPAGEAIEKQIKRDHPIALTLARFLRAADDYREAVFIAVTCVKS